MFCSTKMKNGKWRMHRLQKIKIYMYFHLLKSFNIVRLLSFVGYHHQIPMNLDDIEKTSIIQNLAIITDLVMLFCLNNAPATFKEK